MVVRKARVEDLHRDASTQPHVVGGVDAAARACTDRPEQAVAAGKNPADEVGHRLAGHRVHGTGRAPVFRGTRCADRCTARRYRRRPWPPPTSSTAPRRKAIEHPGRFAIVAGGLTLVALLFAGAIIDRRHQGPPDHAAEPGPVGVAPTRARSCRPRSRSSWTSATTSPPTSRSAAPSQSVGACTALPADQVEFIPGARPAHVPPRPGPGDRGLRPRQNRVIVALPVAGGPGQGQRRLQLVVHLQVLSRPVRARSPTSGTPRRMRVARRGADRPPSSRCRPCRGVSRGRTGRSAW